LRADIGGYDPCDEGEGLGGAVAAEGDVEDVFGRVGEGDDVDEVCTGVLC
jgi:hypothetical protein